MYHFLLACFHFFSFFFSSSSFPFSPVTVPAITPVPTIATSPTATPTPILTEAPTLTPTLTATATPTPTVISTPTATPTPTISITPTETPTPIVSITPTATPTVILTPTSTPTATPTPTVISTPTATPTPTISITLTETPTPTISVTPTATPTPTLTLTPTPTATATPTVSITPTATPTATETPTPTPTITKLGNDISYPQCGQTLPTGQGFGIVGINGGIATTTNPCLSTQLLWAEQSIGTPNQAKLQLYVNTGNPGGLNTASWPKNNTDPAGNTASDPYGTCDGSVSAACSWQYGWNRAVDDVINKFIPTAQSAGIDSIQSDYLWWLDVETTNSWEDTTIASNALEQNRADLEGMVSYFESRGITVGIYSTAYQWGTIVGDVSTSSNLNGLRNWRPGASDLAGAQSNCSLTSLTSGGSVSMTQYTTNSLDYDYSCL